MLSRFLLATPLGLVVCGAASAQSVFMDQIGPGASYVTGTAVNSQYHGSGYSQFDAAVVDNFSVTGQSTITDVDVEMQGSGSFTGYSAITGYQVDVYSSVAAAATSLTGNVASVNLSPGQVNLTAPYGSATNSALVSLPVSLYLPSAGTYYVAVIPTLSYATGAQIGVDETNYAGAEYDFNAYQVNPNGGDGFTSNENALHADAAYRVVGNAASGPPVPEPGSVALLALPIVSLAATRLRRRR